MNDGEQIANGTKIRERTYNPTAKDPFSSE